MVQKVGQREKWLHYRKQPSLLILNHFGLCPHSCLSPSFRLTVPLAILLFHLIPGCKSFRASEKLLILTLFMPQVSRFCQILHSTGHTHTHTKWINARNYNKRKYTKPQAYQARIFLVHSHAGVSSQNIPSPFACRCIKPKHSQSILKHVVLQCLQTGEAYSPQTIRIT